MGFVGTFEPSQFVSDNPELKMYQEGLFLYHQSHYIEFAQVDIFIEQKIDLGWFGVD